MNNDRFELYEQSPNFDRGEAEYVASFTRREDAETRLAEIVARQTERDSRATAWIKEIGVATVTLRAAARLAVIEQVSAAAAKSHERNYEKLHIHREGSLEWNEFISSSEDLIDDEADGFAAVPSVCCVGTGSCGCNCDWCQAVYNESDAKIADAEGRGEEYRKEHPYDSQDEAIMDAVAESDLLDIENEMLASFDSIPVGYFEDEDEDEEDGGEVQE